MINLFKNILISFIHFILSIPFSYFNLINYSKIEYKAYLQPPGYVFGIAWSIIYLLFGIINLNVIYSNSIVNSLKINIINQSVIEALIQTLWLIVNVNYFWKKKYIQEICGFVIIFILVYYAYFVRLPLLKSINSNIYLLYIPYCIWILFALVLSYQLVFTPVKIKNHTL